MANWYAEHLGFSIARAGGEPGWARFLLEHAGSVMLEVYRNPAVPVPNYDALDPLVMHVAFASESPTLDRDRLVRAGARLVEDLTTNPLGDQLIMLRDPWGVALQLVKRASPMVHRG